MVIFVIAAVLDMIWLLISTKQSIEGWQEISAWKKPFLKCALALDEAAEILRRPGGGKRKSNGKKTSYEAKENRKQKEKRLEILTDAAAIQFLGTAISLVLLLGMPAAKVLTQGNGILRPGNGQAEKKEMLSVEIEGMPETEEIEVAVNSRVYSGQEKRKLLKEAEEELDRQILNGNESADEIRGKVGMPVYLMDGKVTVSWTIEPQGALDSDGSVPEDTDKNGETVMLTAVLVCDSERMTCERAVRIFPPRRNEKEELLYELSKELGSIDENSREEDIFYLPEEISGRRLTWKEKQKSNAGLYLFLVIAAIAAACVGKVSEQKKREENRHLQLLIDYPEILFKMSMLLDTGLTIGNVFEKIVLEYRKRETKEIRYAYEEMITSCNEMHSGVSEARAYENFGNRCAEPEYLKLGSLLSSNLRKGSEGLREILRTEAAASVEIRRQTAKKLGEEAGTKMLFPMLLMLVVVLIVLMVPAMLSF